MGIIYQGLTSHPCTHKVTNSLAVTGFGLSFIVTSLTTEEKVPQKLELEKNRVFMCHHESKNKRNSHEAQKKIIWWPVGNAQWIKTR